jgi:hypothetical protein
MVVICSLSFPGSEFFSCQNCEAVAGCSSGLDPLAPRDEDKPYKCQLCRSAFRYKGNLASHRTVHTGRRGEDLGLRAHRDPRAKTLTSLPPYLQGKSPTTAPSVEHVLTDQLI